MTLITMTPTELSRLRLVESLISGDLKPVHVARFLNLSARQVHRLKNRYRTLGPAGLTSAARGRPSNRTPPLEVKEDALRLLRTYYADFGPTFAAQKLREKHGLSFAPMTIRRWMKEDGLWVDRRQRKPQIHQPRARRECYGELIQIDGSQHYWFEDRGPKCTLLVYIDDATSRLMHLRFVGCESAFAYFAATTEYIDRHGKPVAFYSHKHSIFRVTKKGAIGGNGMTQFGRALHELNVDIICANTPQAKGRVERANRTLQDRLVKELRLAGVSAIEEGNAFLPAFIEDYNARFAKDALNPKNLHRAVNAGEVLSDVFVWREERRLSSALTLQYDKTFFLMEPNAVAKSLIGQRVTVSEYPDGRVVVSHKGLSLPYRIFDTIRHVDQGEIVENKRLSAVLDHIRKQQELRPQHRSEHVPRRRFQNASPFQPGESLTQKRRARMRLRESREGSSVHVPQASRSGANRLVDRSL